MKSLFAICVAVLLVAGPVRASAAAAISADAWARASIPGTNTGAVYGTFTNTSESPVVITGIKTDVAKSAMIHETVMKDGMASMHHLASVSIAPGETFTCAPGARHIMLMGVKQPLKQGDRFTITLELKDQAPVTVDVKVGSIGQMSAPS